MGRQPGDFIGQDWLVDAQELQLSTRNYRGCGALQPEAQSFPILYGCTEHVLTANDVEASPVCYQTCTVCMEAFREGEELRILPCLHRFHKGCIDRWLCLNCSCPLCKQHLNREWRRCLVDGQV